MWISLVAAARAAEWPPLDPPAASADRSADAAVVVGIDAYPFIDDVPGARANAEDWFRYLTRTRGISPARVHLLRDVEGTREKVLKELGRAAAEVGPGGTVWFVFVGHGASTPDGRDGVLVGADAQPDPDSLFARSVPRSEILDVLAGNQAVLVLDACFSGRSGRGALVPDLQFVVPTWAAAPAGATLLTAGTATQFAGPLPGAGRPAFSYLVLGALLGWGDGDGDGNVSAREAVGYAGEAIAATVRGREQTPELLGPDVVLGPSAGRAAPDLVELALGGSARPAPDAGVMPAQELEARRAAVEARQLEARHEQEALEAAARSTRDRLDAAAASLQAEARAAFAELKPAMDAGDASVEQAARALVTRYTGARVAEGELSRGVDVPEVGLVVAWLARDRPAAASVSAPERTGDVPRLALWRSYGGWRESLAADPQRIWDPYREARTTAQSLVGELWGARQLTGADVQPLQDLAVDAAAYGEAWFASAPEGRRHLEYALLGAVEEARDLSTALRGGAFHIESTGLTRKLAHDFSEQFSEPRSLLWAIEEVRVRAEKAGEGCAAEVEALDALTDKASAGLDAEADPVSSPAWLRYGRKLRGLADDVHACSGT
jgi:hypothetical protein